MKQLFTTAILFFGCCYGLLLAQDFKSIGYLPHYRFSVVDQIQFDKLTHVNLSFANPDNQGNLSFENADIGPVIEMIHNAGAEVYISLAGGALTSAWAAAWENLTKPQNRAGFIQKIIAYTIENDFDGIDMDLEWSHVDENYSGFVLALRAEIDQTDLGFTAALPGTYRYPQITNAALAAYDWINMMVYDLTGPWAPNNPGPHSPYSFALNAIQYWQNQGVSKDQLTLGVPFYGYDFTDPSNVYGRLYSTIVGLDEANAFKDRAGEIYYNGIPTIEAKTMLAMNQLSGIMIWELGQDHFGEFSLLDRIYNIVQLQVSTNFEKEIAYKVYPNPFDQDISMQFSNPISGELNILDMNGHIVASELLEYQDNIDISTNHLPNGMYIVQFIADQTIISAKLMKG